MKSLYAKGPAELEKILKLEKSYQAKQIYSWLIKGVTHYSLMSDVSKKIRDRLTEEFPNIISSKIVKTQKADSATKLLIELSDGVYHHKLAVLWGVHFVRQEQWDLLET